MSIAQQLQAHVSKSFSSTSVDSLKYCSKIQRNFGGCSAPAGIVHHDFTDRESEAAELSSRTLSPIVPIIQRHWSSFDLSSESSSLLPDSIDPSPSTIPAPTIVKLRNLKCLSTSNLRRTDWLRHQCPPNPSSTRKFSTSFVRRVSKLKPKGLSVENAKSKRRTNRPTARDLSRLPDSTSQSSQLPAHVPPRLRDHEKASIQKQIGEHHHNQRNAETKKNLQEQEAAAALLTQGYTRLLGELDISHEAVMGLKSQYRQLYELMLRDRKATRTQIERTIRDLKEQEWKIWYARSELRRIDQRFANLAINQGRLRTQLAAIEHTIIVINQRIEANIGPLFNAASELIGYTQERKREDGPHARFTKAADAVATSAGEIEQRLQPRYLRALEMEMIRDKSWSPVYETGQPIDLTEAGRLHQRDKSVFEVANRSGDAKANALRDMSDLHFEFTPYTLKLATGYSKFNRSIMSFKEGSHVPNLAHHYRKIDTARGQWQIFPEAAYSTYWSAVTLVNYHMPLELAIHDLSSFLDREEDERTERWDKAKTSRAKRGAARNGDEIALLAEIGRIWSLARLLVIHTTQIAQDYRSLIIGGRVTYSAAQHPAPQLHAFQCRTFRAADMLLDDNANWRNICEDTALRLEQIATERSRYDTLAEAEARRRLIDSLSFRGSSHAVDLRRSWRREMLTLLSEAVTWSSAKFLAFDQHRSNTTTSMLRPLSDIAETRATKKTAMSLPTPKALAVRQNSTKWLTARTLYGQNKRVLIDYVVSVSALNMAVNDFRASARIAWDFIFANAGYMGMRLHYVVVASEDQILILDYDAIPRTKRSEAKIMIQSLMEEDEIQKVLVPDKDAMDWLTTASRITPVNLSNLSPTQFKKYSEQGPSLSSDPISMLDRDPHVYARRMYSDPHAFFFALAARPYAILQAFNAVEPIRSLRSSSRPTLIGRPEVRGLNFQSTYSVNDAEGPTLGPVFVDRSVTGFSQPSVARTRTSRLAYVVGSRSSWLQDLSLQMARNSNVIQRTLESNTNVGQEMTLRIQKACAAYYQFTAFHEPLEAIASGLGFVNMQEPQISKCASWILWVTAENFLPLRPENRSSLDEKAGTFGAEAVRRVIKKAQEANTERVKEPAPGARRRLNRILSHSRGAREGQIKRVSAGVSRRPTQNARGRRNHRPQLPHRLVSSGIRGSSRDENNDDRRRSAHSRGSSSTKVHAFNLGASKPLSVRRVVLDEHSAASRGTRSTRQDAVRREPRPVTPGSRRIQETSRTRRTRDKSIDHVVEGQSRPTISKIRLPSIRQHETTARYMRRVPTGGLKSNKSTDDTKTKTAGSAETQPENFFNKLRSMWKPFS